MKRTAILFLVCVVLFLSLNDHTAQANCLTPVGDLTANGSTNVTDVQCSILLALWVQDGMVGTQPECLIGALDTADVNCDGSIVVTDVVLVIYWALASPLSVSIDADGNLCPDACEVNDQDADGVADSVDCAPQNPAIFPGATESCNGSDDDCNGTIDDVALSACDDSSVCTTDSCIAGVGCSHQPFFATPVHVDLSGVFNADIVVNGSALPLDPTQDAVDNSGLCLVSQSAATVLLGADGYGLPDAGWFAETSFHPDVQLPFTNADDGLNAVLMTTDGNFTVAVPPAAYSEVHVFAIAGSGSPTVTVTLNYSDGSQSFPASFIVPDWFNEITDTASRYTLINGMDRANIAGTQGFNANDPAIFGLRTVSFTSKILTSVTVARTAGGSGRVSFLGVTAVTANVASACDDADPCTTDDFCDPTAGCVHFDSTDPCDDSDPCTTGDVCSGGSCAGSPVTCDDADPCTIDSCAEGFCVHDPFSETFQIDLSSVLDSDVIVNGTAGVIDTTQDPMDFLDYCLITDTAAKSFLGSVGNGLPDDGFFPATTFHPDIQLHYSNTDDGLNAKRIVGAFSSMELPLAPGYYTEIHLYGTWGGASNFIYASMIYDDGTTDFKSVKVPDWFGEAAETATQYTLVNDLDRSKVLGVEAFDANDPAIFGLRFTPDPKKVLSNVTISRIFGGGIFVLFGASATVIHHPELCNDDNGCTDDLTCDSTEGCVFTNNTTGCNDGDVCTTNDTCTNGTCVGTPVVCTDSNDCTAEACNSTTGACDFVANVDGNCDDLDACTVSDTCTNGLCGGSPKDCADGLPCTTDVCDLGTCLHEEYYTTVQLDLSSIFDVDVIVNGTTTSIDNTQDGIDSAGVSFVTQTAATALLGSAGNGLPDDGFFAANGYHPDVQLPYSNTDNGLNAKRLKDLDLFVLPVPNAAYTDIHVFATASPGNSSVQIKLTYSDGTTATTSFQVPDWFTEITDSTSRYTLINDLDRADAFGTVGYDINDPAIFGLHVTADPSKTLSSIQVFLASFNRILTVVGATAITIGHPELCDDNDPCTYALCDNGTGCVHTAHTNLCDDGEICTINDVCTGGTCIGVPDSCDDGNPCSDDSCDPALGCIWVPNTDTCDDNNPCTIQDTCHLGVCDGASINGCNNAPVITKVTLESVHTNQNFECHIEGTDIDDQDVVTKGYLWQVTTQSGSTSVLDVSTSTLAASQVPRTGSVVCIGVLNDGTTFVQAESEPATVKDYTPVVETLALTSDDGSFYVNSTLTCKTSWITDDDGDTVSQVAYVWTKNGNSAGELVVAAGQAVTLNGPFKVGDVIGCAANAYDGYEWGGYNLQKTTIINHPPVCNTASITDFTLESTESATCSCTSLTDKDADTSGYTCSWTAFDGTPMDISGCTVSGTQVPSGWVFNCNIAPVDSYGAGESASIETSRSGNQDVIWNANVTVSPSVIYADPDTELTCTWDEEPVDPDGSGTKVLVEWWYKNKAGTQNRHLGYPPLESYKTIKLSDLTTEASSPLSPQAGGSVYCVAYAADYNVADKFKTGNTWAVLTSPTVTLTNTPAELVSFSTTHDVTATLNTIPAGDTITCTVEISDIDSGNKLKLVFEEGHIEIPGGWTSTEISSKIGTSVSTLSHSYTVPTTEGDEPGLQCIAYLDEGSGYVAIAESDQFLMDYGTPQVQSVSVSPSPSTPCEDRVCTVVVSDTNAKFTYTVPLTLTTRWFVDGVEKSVVSESKVLSAGNLTLTTTAVGVPVVDGSEVVCKAKVTKTTQLFSTEVSSAAASVVGEAPSVESASVSLPARVGDILTCVGGEFNAGCAQTPTYTYAWYADGVKLAGEVADTLDTAGLSGGQAVQCGVSVSDGGKGAGGETLSTEVILDADLWTLYGETLGDLAGQSAAIVGDIDGDGRQELVVGAPGAAVNGLSKAGKAYVVLGTSEKATTELGDLETADGGVVVYGSSGGWDANTSICKESTQTEIYPCSNGTPGTTNGQFAAPRGDGLGTVVSAVGDIDGDGVADLVVAAPYAVSHGEFLTGEVLVLSGPAALDLADAGVPYAKLAAVGVFEGETGFDQKLFYPSNNYKYDGHLFGYGVTSGDFDGDGNVDIAACAPNADPVSTQNGRSYVITNTVGTLWMGDFVDNNGTTPFGAVIDGPENVNAAFFAHMGGRMDNLGDINGDGIDDLLLGPATGDIYNKHFVVLGGTNLADVDLENIDPTRVLEVNDASWSFSFFTTADFIDAVTQGRVMFGSRSSGVGDINGDGLADLALGSLEFEGTESQVEVAVVFGNVGLNSINLDAADAGTGGFTIEGRPAEGSVNTGVLVFGLGDINGDGLDDIGFTLLPSDGNPSTTETVRLYVVFGKTDGTTVSLSDIEADNGGFTLEFDDWINTISHGDIDGDGLSDMAIGISAEAAGSVSVWFGRDYTGTITQRGTKDVDDLTGSSDVDFMIGGLSGDTLSGGGGADAIYGGGGDDIIVADGDVVRIDGGEGKDTVFFTGDVDLTVLRDRVKNIEVIDLSTVGAQTLKVSSTTVRRLSRISNRLVVLGDSVDLLDATDGEWLNQGDVTYQGETLTRYVDGEAELWVEPTVKTLFDPTLITKTFDVPEGAAQGTVAGSLETQDPDGQVVSAAIVGGDPFGIFAFDASGATLVVQKGELLDRETRTQWTLSITMTDNDGLTSTGEIVIVVTNVNEAPTMVDDVVSVTLQEAAADGTVVGLVSAVDIDEGDALVYSVISGNDDGAFSIDSDGGLVTVADGGFLNFEVEPQRLLGIRATDLGGLYAEGTIMVELTDLDSITLDGTFSFATTNQSILSPNLAVGETEGTGSITEDLNHDLDEDNLAVSFVGSALNGLMSISGNSQGKVTMDYGYSVDSGDLSAYLPTDISVVFPDQIPLGTPFTVGLSASLNDTAKLWGHTLALNFWLNIALDNVGLNLLTGFGGTPGAKAFGPYTMSKTFSLNIDSEDFNGVVASTIFSLGFDPDTTGCDLSDTTTTLSNECSWVLSYQLAALGALFGSDEVLNLSGSLGDLFSQDDIENYFATGDYEGAVEQIQSQYPTFDAESGWDYYQDLMADKYGITLTNFDNLLIGSTVTETVLDVSLDPDVIVGEILGIAINTEGSVPWWFTYDMVIGGLGFVRLYVALWSAFLDMELVVKEAFYLQFDGVKATFVFEDGTTVANIAMDGDTEMTLPVDADENNDGKVDFTLTLKAEATFLHLLFLIPVLHYYGDLLGMEATLYQYQYNTSGVQTGQKKVNSNSIGPLQSSNASFGNGVKDLSDSWPLPGLNTITLQGSVQVQK